jgi:hypothetical protein
MAVKWLREPEARDYDAVAYLSMLAACHLVTWH